TGTLHYDAAQPKIPAAAITVEDAEALARMQGRGERIRVRLRMEAHMLTDVESANVVAEVRGREHPEEVVLLGGHIDSWDVGTGRLGTGAARRDRDAPRGDPGRQDRAGRRRRRRGAAPEGGRPRGWARHRRDALLRLPPHRGLHDGQDRPHLFRPMRRVYGR